MPFTNYLSAYIALLSIRKLLFQVNYTQTYAKLHFISQLNWIGHQQWNSSNERKRKRKRKKNNFSALNLTLTLSIIWATFAIELIIFSPLHNLIQFNAPYLPHANCIKGFCVCLCVCVGSLCCKFCHWKARVSRQINGKMSSHFCNNNNNYILHCCCCVKFRAIYLE